MSNDHSARFDDHLAAEKRLEERIEALLLDIPHSLFDPRSPDPFVVYSNEFPNCPVKYREEIIRLRRLIADLSRALDALRLANKVTSEHEWFTIRNYADYAIEPERVMHLFTLHENGAHRIASIRAGDILLVASREKKED